MGDRLKHVLKGGVSVLDLLVKLPELKRLVQPPPIQEEMWEEFETLEPETQRLVRRGWPLEQGKGRKTGDVQYIYLIAGPKEYADAQNYVEKQTTRQKLTSFFSRAWSKEKKNRTT